VPHEREGRFPAFLLPAEFGGYGLKLFDERVAVIVAGNALCAIVDKSTLSAA
jgi:hypothetical protein